MLLSLAGLGIWCRLHAFGFPNRLQFDEHHFVENARNYLSHRVDQNDHPPLGKLILAFAIQTLGDRPAAWRVPSLICGGWTIVLAGVAAARLFRSFSAGYVAAALLCADGFLIAYSRAALLDGFLACAAAGTLLLCSFDLSLGTALLSGGVIGFACGIKFSGIAVIFPLLLAWSLRAPWHARRLCLAALALASAALVFFGSYGYGLALARQPHGVLDVVRDVERLVAHHALLTDMKNPATSGFITWLLPVRPLLLGLVEQRGTVRALTTLGNLAIWWPAMAVALLSTGLIVKHGVIAVIAGDPRSGAGDSSSLELRAFVLSNGRAVLIVLALALSFLAPWVLSHRDSYIYHFLPSYAALVVLLSGFVAWLEARSSRHALLFAIVILLVAAYYAPLWSYLPLDPHAFTQRLFLRSWR